MGSAGTTIDRTRVIGIFAHIDAGKTTTSEAMLYLAGRIHRMGNVDDGNTQLDWMAQERERGITVTAAATTLEWRGHRLNLIDTPGHIDFTAEVVRSIRVIDGAVIVLCGVGGVETQSEAVWMHAEREGLPRVLYVNKLDRLGADLERVLAAVRAELTPRLALLQLPIGREGAFTGVVDILSRRALVWHPAEDDSPALAEPTPEPVPPAMVDAVETARAALIDAICETDEALLERRLAGEEPAEATLRAALRRAAVARRLVPVLCGSSLRRIGIQPLLDAITAYLPSPRERPPVRAGGEAPEVRAGDPEAPLCAAAFKIVSDPYVGHLTWVRILSGRLHAGEAILNACQKVEERVSRIYRIHANRREQVKAATAGDVVALVGVRSAVTGDTLCAPGHPVQLEPSQYPEPVIAVALAAQVADERLRLHEALARLCSEDPTLLVGFDPETGEETLAGLGELHLEIAVDRLRTEFGLAPSVSRPEVAYRETVRRAAEGSGQYRLQTGGHGHYARVQLRIEPLPRGEGIVFENQASASEIAASFVRGVEAGVRETLAKGLYAGYPATDLRVTLLGGRAHEVDSSSTDFAIAASMAVREAFSAGGPALLEPVMAAEVNLRPEYLGGVLGYLNGRRGSVKGVKAIEGLHTILAEVPLAEVRGCAGDLRDLTQGRCTFMLRFLRYDLVPEAIAEGIAAARRAAGKVQTR